VAKDKVILTKKGFEELEVKLEYLKTTKRSEIAGQIKIAREFGDLSENAEYDEAKNEQARVEAEIIEIEAIVKDAEIVDADTIDVTTVNVGAKVKVYDKEYDEEIEYQIVGSAEVDLTKNKISNECPVGGALLGKKIGDKVTVPAPGGNLILKVIDIHR